MPQRTRFYETQLSDKPYVTIFTQLPLIALSSLVHNAMGQAGVRSIDHAFIPDNDIINDIQHYLDTYSVMTHERVTVEEVTLVRNPVAPDYELSPQYGAKMSLIGQSYTFSPELSSDTSHGAVLSTKEGPADQPWEIAFAPELSHRVAELFNIRLDLDTDAPSAKDYERAFNNLLDANELTGVPLNYRIERLSDS